MQPARAQRPPQAPLCSTTDSHHGEPVSANLTFVRLPEGFVYLACLVNAYSRKCIGWSLARRMESRLPRAGFGDGLSPAKGALPG